MILVSVPPSWPDRIPLQIHGWELVNPPFLSNRNLKGSFVHAALAAARELQFACSWTEMHTQRSDPRSQISQCTQLQEGSILPRSVL